jgi:hypothetical protein
VGDGNDTPSELGTDTMDGIAVAKFETAEE